MGPLNDCHVDLMTSAKNVVKSCQPSGCLNLWSSWHTMEIPASVNSHNCTHTFLCQVSVVTFIQNAWNWSCQLPLWILSFPSFAWLQLSEFFSGQGWWLSRIWVCMLGSSTEIYIPAFLPGKFSGLSLRHLVAVDGHSSPLLKFSPQTEKRTSFGFVLFFPHFWFSSWQSL